MALLVCAVFLAANMKSAAHLVRTIEMTVTKEKTTTTKAKTVKAKAVKAPASASAGTISNTTVTEPSLPVVEQVSTVSVVEEVAQVVPVTEVVATDKAVVTVARTTTVAQRAYEIWLACGCEHGRDAEHWLAAEQELKH